MSEGMGASAPTASSSQSQSAPTQGATKNDVVPSSLKHASTEKPTQRPVESEHSQPQRYKVKVDGQEIEVDQDELISGYRKNKAADKRFQEAAELAKQAKAITDAVEKGDVAFLEKKLGKQKTKELFEDYLIKDMEYQALSPAEKRALELEHENKSLKERQQAADKQRQEAEQSKFMEKAHQDLDQEVHEALGDLGVKPTPRLALRVVDQMIAAMESGKETATAKDLSKRALESIHQDIAEYLPHLTPEQLIKLIPQKVRDALREYELNRVMGEKSQRRNRSSDRPKQVANGKPVGVDEWFNKIEQRLK